MAVSDDLLITVKIDTKDGVIAVKDLAVSFDALKKATDPAAEAIRQQGGAAVAAGLRNTELNSTLELAMKAYAAVATIVQKSVGAFINAEKAETNLMNTLKAFGFEAEGAFADLKKFADQLEMTSGISAESTLQMAQVGKATGQSNEQVKKMIETAAGMAAVLGTDVNTNFRELQGQLVGVTGKSAKYVQGLDQLNDAQVRNGKGIELAYNQYAKFADLTSKTLAGALKISEEAFGNLFEEVGKIIVEVLNLPQIVADSTKAFITLADVLKDLGARIIIIKKGFEDIPWQETTAAALALATAIGGALLILNFGAIVAGIGAMGSALAAAAIPAAIIAIKFALIASAILGVIVLVEGIIVNFDKVKAVGTLMVELLSRGMLQLGQLINDMLVFMFTGVQKVLTPLAGYSKVTDGLLKSVNTSIENLGNTAGKNAEKINALTQQIGETSEKAFSFDNLKSGPVLSGIVKGVSAVTGGFTALSGEVNKVKESFNDLSKVPPPGPTKEQIALLAQLKLDTQSMQNNILNMGASQYDILQRNLEGEQARLDLKLAQLEAEGKSSAAIAEQIELQKGLLAEKAAKDADKIGKTDIIPQSTIDNLKGSIGEGAAKFAGSISGGFASFAGGVGAIMGAANGVLDFFQQVIDFIPQILNKIAGIFNSLTDLPLKILDGIKNVFGSITRLISELIPNLLNAIFGIVEGLIQFLIEGLPNAIIGLLEKLPDMLIGLLDKLPDLLEGFVVGLINAMPRVMIALTEFLIMQAPRIAIKFMEVIYIRMPIAIVRGIIEGAKQLVKRLQAFFSGVSLDNVVPKEIKDIGKNIGKGLSSLGKGAAKEASKIFKVMDLEGNSAAIDRLQSAEKVIDGIDEAFENGGQKTLGIFQRIMDMIMGVWNKISAFLSPLIGLVLKVWQTIYDSIMKPFITGITATWNLIYVTVMKPFIDAIKIVWNWVNEYVIKPIVGVVKTAWQGIIDFFSLIFKGKIKEAFQSVIDTLSSMGTQIWNGLVNHINAAPQLFKNLGSSIWEGLWNGLKGVGDFLQTTLNSISPQNLFAKMFTWESGGRDKVEKALGIDVPFVSFATGGIVPGNAMVSGDSLMNDRVLALLSPGEAVIPRTKMSDPGTRELVDMVLKGKFSPMNLYGPKEFIEDTAETVTTTASNPAEAAKQALERIGDAARSPADRAKDLGEELGKGGKEAWEKFKDVAQEVWDALASTNPAVLWDKVKEMVWDGVWQMVSSSSKNFHEGGFVGGSGDVPAVLQAGEYVMRRDAVNQLGSSFLDRMNSGNFGSGSGGGTTTVNMDVKVNIEASSQSLDEKYVRGRLIPSIKDELKKASLRGEFLFSDKGLRTT